MKKFLLIMALLVAHQIPGRAQESEDELADISERLELAERQRVTLKRRLEVADQQVKLLTEAKKFTQFLAKLDEQLEEAEKKDDERRIEQLEEQGEEAEFGLEFAYARLEILEHRVGLLAFLDELDETGSRPLKSEAQALLQMAERAGDLVERLFKVYRDGPESEEAELKEEVEVFHETLERRVDILHMKLELFWAREEGEEDLVRELEAELEELGDVPNFQQKPVPDSKRDKDREEARKLPPPMKLTEQEIVAAGRLDFAGKIVPLLKTVCGDCHSGESSEGGLDLATLVLEQPLVVNRTHWINVIQQLKVRSMPPADVKQPKESDRRTMVAWLTNAIDNFDYSTVKQPGYEQARRLTHEEYNNTIRDLTGIDIRPADRFPADLTATSGFENSANSLFLQPITMERYIGAAEVIATAVWPDQPVSDEQRAAWNLVLGDASELRDKAAVESVLTRFARRAYRRPVEADEIATLVAHYGRRVAQGASSCSALRDVLQVILVSPSFLIRTERDGTQVGQPFRISEWELASRLSYFIWASMPDAELFRLAETGRLSDPEILSATVDRMLRDPKANTLGSIFASQWLSFTDLGRVRPGQIDNPWATDSLIAAMKDESAMLFNSVVKNNAPLDRLVDADYTFVNEELAKHYRMDGVRGGEMRRVSLRASPRRGILGHGSILAVTSFPGRTSPVIRGNWILSKLLGTPPPPPPPNVSEFDNRVAENRKLTQREKLEMHRQNPNCYSCHSQIDPLGFALEEFEWFGRHRPVNRGKPVDTTGQLPGGKPFNGLIGLSKTLLAERVDDLTIQLCRKMLSYALGRQLQYYDEATVQELVEKVQANRRRIPALIHAIVQCDAFQMKQAEAVLQASKQ